MKTARTLETRTRSAGGYTRNSMARPTGVMIAPPAPCRTRKATSSLRPVDSPHSADPIVKMPMAPSSARRPPIRSPSQPEAGMNTVRLTR